MTDKKALNDLDSFIAEARRLQVTGSQNGVEFMRFLFLGEKNPQLWEEYRSFTQVIADANLCPAKRYVDFKAAHSRMTPRQVELIGVDAAIEISKVESPEDFKTAVRAVQAWATDNKAVPNRQRAACILRKTLTHLRRATYVRRHEWLPVNARGKKTDSRWCSHCGTLEEKTSSGVSTFTKPGWEASEDTPPCIRVRHRTATAKAAAA